MKIPALTALLILAPPAAGRGQDERIAALVRQLGDRSFEAREEASRQIVRLGRDAFPALQAGLNDSNAEVRQRCKQILPAIFDQEMRGRLDAFLSDTDPDNDHGLPGWTRFRKLVGAGPAERALFGRMVRSDFRLLDAVEKSPAASGDRLAGRAAQLLMQQQSPDETVRLRIQFADVAGLLFAGCHPGVALSPAVGQRVNALTYFPVFRKGLLMGDDSPAARKLLLAWIERNLDDSGTCNMVASLLAKAPIKEMTGVALRMAANSKQLPYSRAQVLVALGGVGGKDDVPALEALLSDDALVSNFAWNNIRGQTQIRDVALAMAIVLSGEKPAEYGFEALKSHPNFIQSYYYLGFPDDAARSAAREKWQAWKRNQAKK